MARWLPALCLKLSLVCAAGAWAAPMAVTGTLTLELGAGDPVVFHGAGTVSVDANGGFVLPELLFAQTTFVPITTPTIMQGGSSSTRFPRFPIVSLRLGTPAGNRGGHFTNPTPQALNPVPLRGTAFVGLFTTGMGRFPFATLIAPLSPIGNAEGATAMASGFGIQVKIEGAPWRTGVARVTTSQGAMFTRTGFDHRNESFVGSIQYVTPTLVSTNLNKSRSLPGFGTLKLEFIPEPSTALLVVSGITGLAILARGGLGSSSRGRSAPCPQTKRPPAQID